MIPITKEIIAKKIPIPLITFAMSAKDSSELIGSGCWSINSVFLKPQDLQFVTEVLFTERQFGQVHVSIFIFDFCRVEQKRESCIEGLQ